MRERWKSSPGGLGVGCCSGAVTVVALSTTVVTPPRVWVPLGTCVVDAAQTVVVVGLWEGGVAVAIMIDSGWS